MKVKYLRTTTFLLKTDEKRVVRRRLSIFLCTFVLVINQKTGTKIHAFNPYSYI